MKFFDKSGKIIKFYFKKWSDWILNDKLTVAMVLLIVSLIAISQLRVSDTNSIIVYADWLPRDLYTVVEIFYSLVAVALAVVLVYTGERVFRWGYNSVNNFGE